MDGQEVVGRLNARAHHFYGTTFVSPEALAETAVRDLLAQPDDDLLKVAQTIVEENRPLHYAQDLKDCRTPAIRLDSPLIGGMAKFSSAVVLRSPLDARQARRR